MNKNITTRFQEYNQIAAYYRRQEDQQILKLERIDNTVDSEVANTSQVSILAIDLPCNSNILTFKINRNKDIKEAAKSYTEVGAFWNQLEETIIQQEPAMLQVEQKSEKTVDNLEKGIYEIKKAENRTRGRLNQK